MEDFETEQWRAVEGYPEYEVSNLGRVRKNGKLTPLHRVGKGYLRTTLQKDGKQKQDYIHRIVAKAFIPNPENKPTVNHIDGDKNNNRVSNLEWATYLENNLHAIKNNLHKHYTRVVKQYDLQGKLIATYHSILEASKATGINTSGIGGTCRGIHKTAGGYVWRYS